MSELGTKSHLENYINQYHIYNALEFNLIKLEDFLFYLQNTAVSDASLIAYRHALLWKKDQNSYYVNGKHFLCTAPVEYGAIYAMSSLSETIRPTPDSEEINVGMFIYRGVLRLQESVFSHKIKVITDNLDVRLDIIDIPLVIRARSARLLSCLHHQFTPTIFVGLLETDWHEYMPKYYRPSLFEALLKTISDKKKQDNYWEKIAPRYYKFISEIHSFGLIIPEKDLGNRLINLFPNLFPTLTKEFSPTAWFIYFLPEHLQGYILGYPIHMKKPSRQELDQALISLSKLGPTEYARLYTENHAKFYEAFSPEKLLGFHPQEYTTVNEKDVKEEEVFSYSCFDIIPIEDGNKRFFFTRPEIDSLLRSGKNHWTNKSFDLPNYVTISSRDSISKIYKLPPAIPIKDLLTSIMCYTPKFCEIGMYLSEPTSFQDVEN